MATLTRGDIQAWIVDRARKDDRLYDRYGREFEAAHAGEFVAIGDDGGRIVGTDELAVAIEASRRFGAGAFALRRIGADAEGRARTLGS